jgi:hypothetical protein
MRAQRLNCINSIPQLFLLRTYKNKSVLGWRKYLDNMDARMAFFNIQSRLGCCRYIWLDYFIIELALIARTWLVVV